MEIQKADSFILMPSTDNNALTDFPDTLDPLEEMKESKKPFFKLFSSKIQKSKGKDGIDFDETVEFLQNLIEMRQESSKDYFELDSEFAFIKPCNPFEHIDDIYMNQDIRKEKNLIIDHQNEWVHKEEESVVGTQEEIEKKQNRMKFSTYKSQNYKDKIEVLQTYKIIFYFFFLRSIKGRVLCNIRQMH